MTNNPQFLLNMKGIIPEKREGKYINCTENEYNEFWGIERDKCQYGIDVNGIHIPGWLYWHTQLWYIYQNVKDPINHIVKRESLKASFRDNEWIIADAIEEAERDRKGVMIFGSRRLGKSEIIASYLAHGATLFEGTENVVMGGNWGDIDVVMAKVVHGLNKLPDYFKFGRLAENLRKEIELGYKIKRDNKTYERQSWSKIICRNHENGNNTESPAGLTPSRFIMDEIAKSKFSEVLDAAKPAFTSEYGWRCSPILTGTSGDIKSTTDAKEYFDNPDANNFIVRYIKEEGNKKASVFISGMYRMEGKDDLTIGNYIETKEGILLPKDSELFDIPMKVKNDAKALAVIEEERKAAEKSSDPTALLKQKMYYPLNTQELFLTDDGNNFPKEAIQEHIAFLEANPHLQGDPCELYRDTNNIIQINWNTQKKPITEFPLEKSKFAAYKKDAPVIIYEKPSNLDTYFLYISGLDSYNMSSSVWSDSLGSLFIFKRFYDPIGGTFQRRIVAEYTARPDDMKTFHENCAMLIELYNSTCMIENAASATIQWFDLSNKGNLLADGFSLLKEIHPTTSIINKNKGLPATPPVQRHYKELIYRYLTEEIILDFDKDHNPIKKLGVVRIPSIGLLKELLNYNDEGNFDRYVAFGHVLTYEAWADKIYPLNDTEAPPEDFYTKKTIKSPFNLGTNPFGFKSGTNPFGLK